MKRRKFFVLGCGAGRGGGGGGGKVREKAPVEKEKEGIWSDGQNRYHADTPRETKKKIFGSSSSLSRDGIEEQDVVLVASTVHTNNVVRLKLTFHPACVGKPILRGFSLFSRQKEYYFTTAAVYASQAPKSRLFWQSGEEDGGGGGGGGGGGMRGHPSRGLDENSVVLDREREVVVVVASPPASRSSIQQSC